MLKKELPHQHGEGPETAFIQEQLNNIDNFQAIAEIFKQLGDTTRIRIFFLLCHCEECVLNISAMLDMSSPAVSHHLRPLRNSGLIVSRREGKEVYYRAADTAQSRLLHQMIEQVMEIACPKAAGRLAADNPTASNLTVGNLTADSGSASPCRSGFNADAESRLTEYQAEQAETIRKIHEQLMEHLEQRFTIEALAKQYLMNPTTLKAMFKSVYGSSIAAHMKEHRMEHAAKLLRETNLSIAEIAGRVGYDSQSRFTAAFKEYSGKLPRDYRSNPTS